MSELRRCFIGIAVVISLFFVGVYASERLRGDLDGDGQVDFADFVIFAQNFGKTGGEAFDPYNLADTSVVNYRDTIAVTVVDTFWGFRVVRDTVERVVYEYEPEKPKLVPRITVLPGDWNRTDLPATTFITPELIQTVCESVRDVFVRQLVYAFDSDILIHYRKEGPRVFYDRSPTGAYRIGLSIQNTSFSKLAFEFAHEYAHILQNYYRISREDKQKWFQESLCSMASLYILRKMDAEWLENPPEYPGWDFRIQARSKAFRLLSRQLINRIPEELRNLDGLYGWYQVNLKRLEANPYLREKNDVVAFHLLSVFETNPEAWNTVRYLNSGPYTEEETFEEYLEGWYYRTPPQWQPLVSLVMKRFGFYFFPKPALPEEPSQWIDGHAYLPN